MKYNEKIKMYKKDSETYSNNYYAFCDELLSKGKTIDTLSEEELEKYQTLKDHLQIENRRVTRLNKQIKKAIFTLEEEK